MEIFLYVFFGVMALALLTAICAGCKLFWDENPNFAEFVKGLGSPVPGHKMVDKEKRPHQYLTGVWEYWWKCECEHEDHRSRLESSFKLYLEHRRYVRHQIHSKKWKESEKAPKKGWL